VRSLPKWKTHSAAMRAKHQIPASATPWTRRGGVQLTGCPSTARVRDLLDVIWAAAMKQSPRFTTSTTLRKGLWSDISQDIERQPMTLAKREKGMPVFTTSSVMYSFEFDMTLSGTDHLVLLGHPPARMSRAAFSESQMRNLAGEGYSIPCASIITFLLFANPHGQWW